MADDDQAIAAWRDGATHVMITGINRRSGDIEGVDYGRSMRERRPALSVIYLAALWPVKLRRCALDVRERFLSKPVRMEKLVRTVRELLPA